MYRQVTRYQQRAKKTQRGFTLVELLVVVVVIAILAAITVILYDNIATNAYDTSLKSDLKNAQDQLEIDHATLRTYPATAAQANGGQGLKSSPGNTLSYSLRPYGYCVTGSNPDASTSFMLRSINSTGQIEEGDCDPSVTWLAGNYQQLGHVDGSATNAEFKGVWGVAMDTNGNLYASEGVGKWIRKITPTGTVSTFAGTGVSGTTDGPGAVAQFNAPKTLTFDKNGNLIVADTDARHVRKITPTGVVSTLIDSSTGQPAWFNRISGLAVDNANNLYIFEAYIPRIWKVTPNGSLTVLAGSGVSGYADGTGSAAQFYNMGSMTMGADGNLYVADTSNNRVRRVTLSGVVTTVAGTGTAGDVDGPVGTGQLNDPIGITADQNGYLYVIEGVSGNLVMRIISPDGTLSTVKKQDGSNPFYGSGNTYVYEQWMGSGYDWNVNSISLGNDGALYIETINGILKVYL